MRDPQLERAHLTIARLTSPEILEANLIRASFFLTAYELFRLSVVDQLRRTYLEYRPSISAQEREARYQAEVQQLDRNSFGASLKWYEKEGVLSALEVSQAQELRELQNQVAHCLPELLTELNDKMASLDVELLEVLTARLDRWFVRTYEIPEIEELDGKEVPDIEIMSGRMALLFLMRKTLAEKAK